MEKKVGKITERYKQLKKFIGHGGFGEVYMLYSKLVVKEEHKVCIHAYGRCILIHDSSFSSTH